MITFPCVGCGHHLQIKEYFAGCKVQCPNCKAELTTPEEALPPAARPVADGPTFSGRGNATMSPEAAALAPPVAARPKPPALPPMDNHDARPRSEPMVAIPGLLEGSSAAKAIPVSLPAAGQAASPWDDASTPASRPEPAPPTLTAPPGSERRSWMDSSPSWPTVDRSNLPQPPKLPDDLGDDLGRPRQRDASGKALGSMILGLATFIVPVLCAVPALILGVLALFDIRRSRGRLEGRGLALSGIILGIVGNVSIWPLWLVKKQFDYSRNEVQVKRNLEEIGKAFAKHHDKHGSYPEVMHKNGKGQLTLSWRVHLLPELGHETLYKEFRLEEPWDSPHNLTLLPRMPPVYASESRHGEDERHATHFRVFVGPDALFRADGKSRRSDIADNWPTFLVVEARQAVPWTKPDELNYRDGHIPLLGASSRGGFYAATLEGPRLDTAAHFVSDRVERLNIHNAINPRDNRPVVFDPAAKVPMVWGKDVAVDKVPIGMPPPVVDWKMAVPEMKAPGGPEIWIKDKDKW